MFPLGFGLLTILLFSGRMSSGEWYGVLLAAFLFLIVLSAFCRSAVEEQGKIDVWRQWKDQLCGGVSPTCRRNIGKGDVGAEFRTPDSTTEGASAVLSSRSAWQATTPLGTILRTGNEGAQWTFRLRSQIRVLVQSAELYQDAGGGVGIAGPGCLGLFCGEEHRLERHLLDWPLIAAGGLSIGAYSLVLVTPRYVGGSACCCSLRFWAGIRLPRKDQTAPLAHIVATAGCESLFSIVADFGGDGLL